MRFLKAALGCLLGGIGGYFAGAYIGCSWYPNSNLCGLYGVFLTAPIGALAGAVVGWRLSERRRHPRFGGPSPRTEDDR